MGLQAFLQLVVAQAYTTGMTDEGGLPGLASCLDSASTGGLAGKEYGGLPSTLASTVFSYLSCPS